MQSTQTMEQDPAFKKKETLPFATTRRDLEDIMLSEIHQSEKDGACIIPLMWGI